MVRRLGFIGLLLALLVTVMPAAAQTTTQTVYGTVQEFEHGLMIWRSDTAMIWALVDNGVAYSFPSASYSNIPDNPIVGDPPSRLRPIFGFGKVWGNVANVRNQLGWPIRSEIGFNMPIATSGGVVSITQLDGTVIRIAGGSWTRGAVTPTPPPTPVPGASILTFDYSPQVAPRGTNVTFAWTMQGVDTVLVEAYDTWDNTFITSQTGLPVNGSTSVTVPNLIQGDMRVVVYGARITGTVLSSGSYERVVQRSVTIEIREPATQTISTYAAYQDYQRGFMIWRADNEAVYVFQYQGSSGGTYTIYPISSYRNLPNNPIADNPPSTGLVKPINAFGRIWGNSAAVRNGTGWAINNEQGYSTSVAVADGIVETMTVPNGGTIVLTRAGQWAYV